MRFFKGKKTLKNVVNDGSKDYTRDGLYKPKQISDERMTGGDLSKTKKNMNQKLDLEEIQLKNIVAKNPALKEIRQKKILIQVRLVYTL